MSGDVRAIRGFNDILPPSSGHWQMVEHIAADILGRAGYGEIRLPLVESTSLFARSIGASTDIVEKEMYTFEDRNGDSLSLRPEGTASCVRAGISHGLFNGSQQRLWYRGPMFRHERPQKGRYRQFHQIGAEAFGIAGADIEAELIALSAELWRRLGLDRVTLKINSLGSVEDRARYREALVDYLKKHEQDLDEDSRRRLSQNPMRILDSKAEQTQAILQNAPHITDYLDENNTSHFAELCRRLDALGIEYEKDPFLVRGLDYYTGTVFEWVTDALGAQDAVCSGGRYDGLVEQLGGRATPAIGWALGMERLILLAEACDRLPESGAPHVYFVTLGLEAECEAMVLAQQLRSQVPSLRLVLNMGSGSLKAQLRRADKARAGVALIMGDAELEQHRVTVKFLREKRDQQALDWGDLKEFLRVRVAE
ncbi:MAG TPA: histidine--tRNA ligase [Gammaproteobacteria bacterium]|nr:histidine--tRNA ligase [Gammaproteobacteria bacterium]